jgi:hypothetical protein
LLSVETREKEKERIVRMGGRRMMMMGKIFAMVRVVLSRVLYSCASV